MYNLVKNNIVNVEIVDNLSRSYHHIMAIKSYTTQYINGEFVASTNTTTTIEVVDPNTAEVIATVPQGTEADTEHAIAAATAAFPAWSQRPSIERVGYITEFVRLVEQNKQVLVNLTVAELGCTTAFAEDVQVAALITHTHTLLDILSSNKDDSKEFAWEEGCGTNATVLKEPIGVVGCITPWNYPCNQIALKIIPALLAGCTVVLKPSEVTPLVAYLLMEFFHASHLPPGVLNMVMGYGPDCGELLARHPDVALVSFTGSTRAGQRLTTVAATQSDTMKPIKTELGGKSATLLLEDADYEKVIPIFVQQLLNNTGQSCNALSRMLVPRHDYDRCIDLAVATMQHVVIGDTRRDPTVTMGPVVSQVQYDRVRALIQQGIEKDGATVVCGGPDKPDHLRDSPGYYIQPTLFKDVTNDMTIAQTEIFGPVLCVLPYETVADAIAMTNDTPYGLNNAVASTDVKKALQVAAQLDSGMVMINNTTRDPKGPFGGYKLSGNAREWGVHGLNEYLITKTLNINLEDYRTLMYGK